MPVTHTTPANAAKDTNPALTHVVVTVKALERGAGAYHRPVRDGDTFDRACGGSDDGVALVHATTIGADNPNSSIARTPNSSPAQPATAGVAAPAISLKTNEPGLQPSMRPFFYLSILHETVFCLSPNDCWIDIFDVSKSFGRVCATTPSISTPGYSVLPSVTRRPSCRLFGEKYPM